MKILTKKVAALSMAVFLLVVLVLPSQSVIAAARDCDANALIYCGTLSKDELNTKLTNGTGKPYQSSAELKQLFGYYGISGDDFSNLQDGYVTNDNRVVVGGKNIATNVYTMGRSYMPGSQKLNQFPYPVYQRHPSVSFRSSQISAFVSLNPDNTLKYAIIKSCGNIVPGVRYVPQTTPKYQIYALKWLDINGNGTKETNEPTMPGVTFSLSGGNYRQSLTTDSNGYARFTNLDAGLYTLSETVPNGYKATTVTTRNVNVSGPNGTVFGNEFGNQIIPTPKGGLQVFKFNDINGNGTQDDNEPAISGWKFRAVGPDKTEFELVTGPDGFAERNDLSPGIYTVTEILEEGWTATTDMSLHKEVKNGVVTTYIFGNRLYSPTKKTGGGDSLPVTGPIAVATLAGSAALFSGSAVAWARSKKRFLRSFRK